MFLLKYFFLFFLCTMFFACTTKRSSIDSVWKDEYSLDSRQSVRKDESSIYIGGAIKSPSSLPLPIVVGSSGNDFDRVPKKAYNYERSIFVLKRGKCSLMVSTGPVQIDQFIYTNRWIKMQLGLKARSLVRLSEKQYGSFRATLILFPKIKEKDLSSCKSELYGKRLLLGKAHINRTEMGLIHAMGSKAVRFTHSSPLPKPRKIYVNWALNKKYPSLIDEFDIPVSLETKVFRGYFAKRGSYYLKVRPMMSFKKDMKFSRSLKDRSQKRVSN